MGGDGREAAAGGGGALPFAGSSGRGGSRRRAPGGGGGPPALHCIGVSPSESPRDAAAAATVEVNGDLQQSRRWLGDARSGWRMHHREE